MVHAFEGHAHGDEDLWEAHISIEIRTENDTRARSAVVQVAWDGPEPGSVSLQADKDGKIDERIGNFSTTAVQFTITSVTLEGFAYRPELNHVPGSIIIKAPDD